MYSKLTSLLAAAALVGSFALAPHVFAQSAQPSAPTSQGQDSQGMPHGQGMMGGSGMMGGQGMMGQMNRMAENCNRMMESMNTNQTPSGPASPQPAPRG